MKDFIDRQINLIFMARTMLLSIFMKKKCRERREEDEKKKNYYIRIFIPNGFSFV